MRSKSILVMALLFIAVSLQAETITIFDANDIIADGDVYDAVVVKGDGTVVDMTGGSVRKIITMNGSTLNVSGGQSAPGYGIGVRTHDTSTVNVSGGDVNFEHAGGSSHVNIFGQATVGTIFAYRSAVVSVSGGTVERADLWGRSRMIITGGTVQQVGGLSDTSRLDISGGTLGWVNLWNARSGEPALNVIGNNLSALPYTDFSSYYGMISGRWNDGTPFTINFDYMTYDIVTLWDGVVPPDCVKAPASDASGDCKVDLTDLAIMSTEWLEDGTQ